MAQFFPLDVPASAGVGASLDVSAAPGQKTVIVGGAFGGSLYVQVSEDGVVFATYLTFSGAPGKGNIPGAYQFIRVSRSGTVSGAPSVVVGY